ncbi:MAG TPA: PVC-type heme-binding CxxCH protein, partial [Planctomycetia bacterium]|nr:PVC-type heme-binding CxxCH protein [Planctomycetia bacterium]
ANRLAYLHAPDPYYVGLGFARLTTPAWVGEPGVKAVVVLAIDDMRGHEKWEAFLRPALERLKLIDGRAPVSIMTNRIDPKDPHLQKWLAEGLSLETHTFDHPCPLLAGGDLAKAKSTYDRTVDLMAEIPGSSPVAFRMPCCDSQNTLSPRFFAEIFNRTTPAGRFLSVDSSVFHMHTPCDAELPRTIVFDRNGRDRYRPYSPADRSFANVIEDYPYPYPVFDRCWEFPCAAPSDWQAFHRLKSGHPQLLEDWKASLDATVIKQGTMSLVFHPYGWSTERQIAEFVDYADKTYGKGVKFLNFRESKERLEKNVLGGAALRQASGADAGARLLDFDGDGHFDVVRSDGKARRYLPNEGRWAETSFPAPVVNADGSDAGVRFGIAPGSNEAMAIVATTTRKGAWRYSEGAWKEWPEGLAGLEIDGRPVETARDGRDLGLRLLDVDGDGTTEVVIANTERRTAFAWTGSGWKQAAFGAPAPVSFVDAEGRDAGLRLVDLDGDGALDLLFANENDYGVHLFADMKTGWSRAGRFGKQTTPPFLPPLAIRGSNQGAWFRARTLWIQNEHTAVLPNLVDRRSFAELLEGTPARAVEPGPALRAMQTTPGFTVELVAAEPLVDDPITIDWGADGKLWVAEMTDYPRGRPDGKPAGRIRFLEDRDGDGWYERSTVFLDGIGYPTGATPWGKGVIVTAAPEVFYAEDRDGDGKADHREALYSGFKEGNPQHCVNGFEFGLDGWLYGANGDSGGAVRSMKTGTMAQISGRDFRIDPSTGGLELETGMTQYGRCRNDWGDWFGGNNVTPMWHFLLPERYLRRNPNFAPPTPRREIAEITGPAPVFPASRTIARFNDLWAANRFTSA